MCYNNTANTSGPGTITVMSEYTDEPAFATDGGKTCRLNSRPNPGTHPRHVKFDTNVFFPYNSEAILLYVINLLEITYNFPDKLSKPILPLYADKRW